ncbi:hypothetical protein EXIGLDRAFT_707110 [Exidia glandulosa HHB12029]|uniref:Uncharacterized protein n=1 Tax=Exidia glandulosa HHB12029 TaxID=1314781 RepID=A0A165JZR7_EXIGL|nr:hypothetical protein EXIGLDRAFT_707110 [Exidia glandulosa HHB12029]
MTDILRNDHAIQRALPNQYSELLQPACNGHALWAPRRTAGGGGALGDIGYIRDGSFWKEGNVYVDPPASIQPLVAPTSGIYRGEHFHMPIMQSSSSSTVSFQVTGSATPATLPLTSVSVEPRFILKRKRLAFLAPPIPTVRDTVSIANETAFCDWLTDNRHRLDPSLVVLTHVVRSSGWIGGVVTGRNSNASVSVSGMATVSMDASVEYEVARLALTQGPRPTEWSENDAEYTLIRQLHKMKLALAAGNSQQSSDTMTPSAGTVLMPRQFSISDWGQGSAGSQGMSAAAEDQAEQTPEQNEDDIDSVDDAGYDDEGDRTCLDDILDMVLDDNQDIDFVVADSRIVADFIQNSQSLAKSLSQLAFDRISRLDRSRR